MNRTFGAPWRARSGSGQAGCETSKVRPTTPENALPGLYSLRAILIPLSLATPIERNLTSSIIGSIAKAVDNLFRVDEFFADRGFLGVAQISRSSVVESGEGAWQVPGSCREFRRIEVCACTFDRGAPG